MEQYSFADDAQQVVVMVTALKDLVKSVLQF